MMTENIRIPPPQDGCFFERVVLDAVRIKWSGGSFAAYGRSGQHQNGVDIYGKDVNGKHIAIQCKCVANFDQSIINKTLSELKQFAFKIDYFYFVVSLPRDRRVQDHIFEISQRYSIQGLFQIEILFWDDVLYEITKDLALFFCHYPQYMMVPSIVENKIESLRADVAALFGKISSEKNISIEIIRSIFTEWSENGIPHNEIELTKFLREKADEYLQLIGRLRNPSRQDPRIAERRALAADYLAASDFKGADRNLEEAENIDLAEVQSMKGLVHHQIRSVCETRRLRAETSKLRENAIGFLEAANHYAEAATIIAEIDGNLARNYTSNRLELLFEAGHRFGKRDTLDQANLLVAQKLADARDDFNNEDMFDTTRYHVKILSLIGNFDDDVKILEECVCLYEDYLIKYPPIRSDSKTRDFYNLATMYSFCFDMNHNEVYYRRSLELFDEALKNFTDIEDIRVRAAIQSNKANLLTKFGRNQAGIEVLDTTIELYKSAVADFAQSGFGERFHDYIVTRDNYSKSLCAKFDISGDKNLLDLSSSILSENVDLVDAERYPVLWAMVRNNLGVHFFERKPKGVWNFYRAASLFYEAAVMYQHLKVDGKSASDNLAQAINMLSRSGVDPELIKVFDLNVKVGNSLN